MADLSVSGFKTCSKCQLEKSLDEFGPSPRGLYGRRSTCRACHRKQVADHRSKNAESVRERARQKYRDDPSIAAAYSAKYRQKNIEKILAREKLIRADKKEVFRLKARQRMERDRAAHNEKSRAWRKANPEKAAAYTANWVSRNRDKVNRAALNRIQSPRGKLNNAVRSGVHRGLKRGAKGRVRTFSLLGYSIAELMAHLEAMFQDGMTWENYGAWHIDHVIPISVFNFDSPLDIDFKRAWDLSNLRPLWAKDNRVKHAKLMQPFQPSLRI